MIPKNFQRSRFCYMTKFHAALLLFLMSAGAAWAQDLKPSTTPEGAVVKIATNLIQLDAVVTDAKGNPIRGLAPADFEVYENGRKQDISVFSFVTQRKEIATTEKSTPDAATGIPTPPVTVRPETVRRTIALVVDDLSLSYESMNKTRRSLKKFVDEQMADGDLVAIIRVGVGMGALQQFTSDKRQLLSAIEKLKWNPLGRGRIGAFAPINDGLEHLQKQDRKPEDQVIDQQLKDAFNDFQESIFATGTLGALRFVVDGLRELPGRKAVVLFSDGIQICQRDEHGYTNRGRVNEFLKILIDLANRSSVVFYTMDARGLEDTGVTAQDSLYTPGPKRFNEVKAQRTKELFDTQDGLVHLAEETGGFPVLFQNDLNAGLKKVLEDQSYYLIGYVPNSETFDAKTSRFNKLEIKVLRDGANIRYRSGFFNNETKAATAKAVKPTPAERLQEALTSPFVAGSIALRINALYSNNVGRDNVTTLLHVNTRDLKFADGPGGSKKASIEVFAVTYGDNGVPVDKIVRTFDIDVKPNDFEGLLERGLVCFFNFPIKKPGPYQFRVAIRDAKADTIGSASQFIEVPDIKKKALMLSGIELQNFSTDQWERMTAVSQKVSDRKEGVPVGQGDPMADTSLRQFRRGTVLHYSFDIYNVVPVGSSLTMRLRVFRDGRLLLDGKPVLVDRSGKSEGDRVRANGAMNLPANMVPGEYVLQVIVSDGDNKKRTVAEFVQIELL